MLWPRVHLVAGALLTVLAIGHRAIAAPSSFPSGSPDNGLDPFAVFVAEASQRFGVPAAWIRAVMHVESGGVTSATSAVGAIGLMQVMPQTYAALRARLGLGANAYDPHDNIIAGAAYLREMHDRYGSPGFLAAYNAGPGRWQDHLAGVRQLPAETVRYIARLAPVLGIAHATSPALWVPLAVVTPERAPIFVMLRGEPATSTTRPNQVAAVHVAAADGASKSSISSLFMAEPEPPTSNSEDAEVAESTASRPPWRDTSSSRRIAPIIALDLLFIPRTPAREQP